MVPEIQNAYDLLERAPNNAFNVGLCTVRGSELNVSPRKRLEVVRYQFCQFTWILAEKSRNQMKLMRRVGRILRSKWLWGILLLAIVSCGAFAAFYSSSDGVVRLGNAGFPRYPANVADREVTAEYFLSLVEDPNVTSLAYETFKKTASGKEVRWPMRLDDLTSRKGDGAAGRFSLVYQPHSDSEKRVKIDAQFRVATEELLTLRRNDLVYVSGKLLVNGNAGGYDSAASVLDAKISLR